MGLVVVSLNLGNPAFPLGNGLTRYAERLGELFLRKAFALAQKLDVIGTGHGIKTSQNDLQRCLMALILPFQSRNRNQFDVAFWKISRNRNVTWEGFGVFSALAVHLFLWPGKAFRIGHAVSHADFGKNVARRIVVLFDFAADVCDVHPQDQVVVGGGVGPPYA